MKRIHYGLASVILLLVLGRAASVFAQGGTPLQYGQTVQGAISNEAPAVRYTFTGSANDIVTIEMTQLSGGLDPYLALLDGQGEEISSNDDIDYAGGNYNARIEQVVLPESGSYTIVATRFNQAEGTSTGNFSLTLTLVPRTAENALPDLGVDYAQVTYNQTFTGELSTAAPTRYYAFLAEAGDLVNTAVMPVSADLIPVVRFLDSAFNKVSTGFVDDETGETVVYYAVPEAGWYLIELGSQGAGGAYRATLGGFGSEIVEYGAVRSAAIDDSSTAVWYVFFAKHGDVLDLEMTVTEGDLVPLLILGDVNLNDLGESTRAGGTAMLNYTVQRSGTYVVLALREDDTSTGAFTISINGTPADPNIFGAESLGYDLTVQGAVSDQAPVRYYSFQAKAGDLVTLMMEADDPTQLDPYLILLDSELNELAFSDDIGSFNTARIFQYELPQSDVYYVLATRYGMAQGATAGTYTLSVTSGEVELTGGTVAATLRWDSTADLDIFVTDPLGNTVAWDQPQVPSGGILEVDTNSNCTSLTPLPVEHIYWPEGTNLPGVYTVSVIYQLDCENQGAVDFDLSVTVGTEEVARVQAQLTRQERYTFSITVNPDGSAVYNDDAIVDMVGVDTSAAESLAYGQTITSRIDDSAAFVAYTFDGAAGDQVLITAEQTSGDLDTYLELYDTADTLIDEDDDSGGNRNARLVVTLPAGGTYTIRVSRYGFSEGTSSGEFRLSLVKMN